MLQEPFRGSNKDVDPLPNLLGFRSEVRTVGCNAAGLDTASKELGRDPEELMGLLASGGQDNHACTIARSEPLGFEERDRGYEGSKRFSTSRLRCRYDL